MKTLIILNGIGAVARMGSWAAILVTGHLYALGGILACAVIICATEKVLRPE